MTKKENIQALRDLRRHSVRNGDPITNDVAACIIDNHIHRLRRAATISGRANGKTFRQLEQTLQTIDVITALNMAKEALRDSEDCTDVRHGTWSLGYEGEHGYAYCSACKRRMNEYLYGYSHCAMCGARMDGKDGKE